MTRSCFGEYLVKLISCFRLVLLCLYITAAGACQNVYSGAIGPIYQLPGVTFLGWEFQNFEWADYRVGTLQGDNVQRDKLQGWNPQKWSPELWWRKPAVAEELAEALLSNRPERQNSGALFVTYRIVNGERIEFFRSDITPLVAFQHNEATVFNNPRVGVTGGLGVGAPPDDIRTPVFGLDIQGFRNVINGNPLDLTFVMARRNQGAPPALPPGPGGPWVPLPAGGGLGVQQVPEPHSATILGIIFLTFRAVRGLRTRAVRLT